MRAGITAETLVPFAAKGATLILVGRTAPPGDEQEELKAQQSPADLRRHLIELAGRSNKLVVPAEIERKLQAILRDREIRSNIKKLSDAGAVVHYRVADMLDPHSVECLLKAIYREFGCIDGVIHGAGMIDDHLLVDKSPESWNRVVGTKIKGALALVSHLRSRDLKFLVFFTSVAGRFGNSGQTDYATANELLNRLACQLNRIWAGNVKLSSINWGPWAATEFGAGMVSEETKRKFESKGVRLVTPDGGAEAVMDELLYGPSEDVEIVIGEGPWEQHEAEVGAFQESPHDEPAEPADRSHLSLLAGAVSSPGAKGGYLFRRTLDLDLDLYLRQHLVDNQPVLPAAVAAEMMAEAAAAIWPDWHVAEIADVRVFNGIQLGDDSSREIEITALGAGHGDAEGFTATMELRPPEGKGAPYYRATVGLRSEVPEAEQFDLSFAPAASPLTAHEAYEKWLFHGPCFQVATHLGGLDDTGIVADLSATPVAEFIKGEGAGSHWLFDPGLVDCAAQMALVWAEQTRSEAALPSRFTRILRYGHEPIEACRMYYMLHSQLGEHQVCADVAYVDADGRLRMKIEQLECTSSASLNRICGYDGQIRV